MPPTCEYGEGAPIPFEFKFAGGDARGAFEGYGAVFGNVDAAGDVIQRGAFAATLARHKAAGTMPKMLLNHGSMGGLAGGPMADLPIGKWTSMSEDSHGLQVKGRLINLDTERGKTVYGAMREGELDGLSIGYRARSSEPGKPGGPRRILKEVDLLEVSPVTFPANSLARVSSVKRADHTGGSAVVALKGIVTVYDKPHIFKGLDGIVRDEIFAPKCFAKSLIEGGAPLFFLDHDHAKCVTLTESDLELSDTADMLAFRFRVPDSPLGRLAVKSIESGERTEMSPGYTVSRSSLFTVRGMPTRLIYEAQLLEISLGAKGVVPGTAAMLDTRPLDPLSAESKIHLNHSYAADKLSRALRRACGLL